MDRRLNVPIFVILNLFRNINHEHILTALFVTQMTLSLSQEQMVKYCHEVKMFDILPHNQVMQAAGSSKECFIYVRTHLTPTTPLQPIKVCSLHPHTIQDKTWKFYVFTEISNIN